MGGEQQGALLPVVMMEASSRASVYMVQDRRDFTSSHGMIGGIRRVIEFLAARSYPRDISEQALSSPTTAMYRDVFGAVASLVDPYFAEDFAQRSKTRGDAWPLTVIQFYKQVRYPFQLSPKQLAAVGSANAWPKFLGALVWLVDLVELGESVEQIILAEETERKKLFDFLSIGYSSFMQGEDEAFQKVLLRLRANVDGQMLDLKKSVDTAQAKVELLENDLSQLRGEENASFSSNATGSDFRKAAAVGQAIELLSTKLDRLLEDAAKSSEGVNKWKNKLEATRSRLAKQEADEAKLGEELKEARFKMDLVQKELDSQLLKSSDLTRIASDRVRLAKALEEIVRSKQLVDDRCWDLKSKVETDNETFQKKVQEFNSRLIKILTGSDISLAVEPKWREHASGSGPLLDVPQDMHVRDVVHAQVDRWLQISHTHRDKGLELNDTYNRNSEECAEIERRIESLKAQTKRLDDKLHSDAARDQAELEQLEQNGSLAAERLEYVQRGGLTVYQEEEGDVRALKTQLETDNSRYARESLEHDQEIQRVLQVIMTLKEEVEFVTKSAVNVVLDDVVSKSRAAVDAHQVIVGGRKLF